MLIILFIIISSLTILYFIIKFWITRLPYPNFKSEFRKSGRSRTPWVSKEDKKRIKQLLKNKYQRRDFNSDFEYKSYLRDLGQLPPDQFSPWIKTSHPKTPGKTPRKKPQFFQERKNLNSGKEDLKSVTVFSYKGNKTLSGFIQGLGLYWIQAPQTWAILEQELTLQRSGCHRDPLSYLRMTGIAISQEDSRLLYHRSRRPQLSPATPCFADA